MPCYSCTREFWSQVIIRVPYLREKWYILRFVDVSVEGFALEANYNLSKHLVEVHLKIPSALFKNQILHLVTK